MSEFSSENVGALETVLRDTTMFGINLQPSPRYRGCYQGDILPYYQVSTRVWQESDCPDELGFDGT